MIVVPTIPIRSAPFIRLATSAPVPASPMANTRTFQNVRSWASPVKGWPLALSVNTVMRCWPPALPMVVNPMNAMNSPMPIPMARFRSRGMAFRTASRNPVTTSAVMTSPSATMTPMAWGQERWSADTSVNATNALRPRPAASANG